MARYAAVFFDLFDTLVRFRRDQLPAIEINGKTVRSTAGRLHDVLCPHVPDLTLEGCYGALLASWTEAERLRSLDDREVPAPARFTDFFRRLSLDPEGVPGALRQALLDAHRDELSRAAIFPDHHGPLLRRLATTHQLAVVSNFDYTPTALGILESAGVKDLFATIVVSDEVGWRKPRADIFQAALQRTGADPARTLFVGDRADIDVIGAHGVGMDAAWINPDREPLPAGIAAPRFEIRDLAELEEILQRPGGATPGTGGAS
jgi:putative hydrolase of the HAD superfamily